METSNKQLPFTVINNNSQGSKTTNNFNRTSSTFHNVNSVVEFNSTKSFEAKIRNSILKMISIKFDSAMSDVSKNLDTLVESKVQKYLFDCGAVADNTVMCS
jgi:hypothetical protein